MARHRLLLFCALMLAGFVIWLVNPGCQSYPRYSNTTVYEKPTSPERDENREPTQHTEIDQALMVRIIDDYLGTPYKKGGATINGIDCSNLVRNVFYELDGRSLPPDARRMYRTGTPVERDELKFGDLVFFSFGTRGVSHVGIYVGNGKFAHASEARGVIISSLDESSYAEFYRGARRLF